MDGKNVAPLKQRRRAQRVLVDAEMISQLMVRYPGASVSEIAKRSNMSYLMVYNILHRRVRSMSPRHYRQLFGQRPPLQNNSKVDGTYFRKMAALWIYLHDGATKATLYNTISFDGKTGRPDYRIFSGQTRTINAAIERAMQRKFTECGIDPPTIQRWIEEMEAIDTTHRVAYAQLRPVLAFLKAKVGIHPTAILKQLMDRYESGELKTVSSSIYDQATNLQQQALEAIGRSDRPALERIREAVYGTRPGYVRYSEIEEDIRFLKRFANKGPKRYLGRSAGVYENGMCKRIAAWRAEAIRSECRKVITSRTDLPLACLPSTDRVQFIRQLQATLTARAADMLNWSDGLDVEKKILSPARPRSEYTRIENSFTQFDRASHTLGMKKRAFDLMVAKHCDIFRMVGKYAKRWYLSDLYLRELAQNEYFNVVTTKYERMAKMQPLKNGRNNICMN